jgi:hypothetical protein
LGDVRDGAAQRTFGKVESPGERDAPETAGKMPALRRLLSLYR